MQKVIKSWYSWLKKAISTKNQELNAVYSDGRQLWATDGFSLHARQVALVKQGRVTLSPEGLFAVTAVDDAEAAAGGSGLPPFAKTLPQGEPLTTLVIDRDRLLQALKGQDRQVRLALYAAGPGMVELSSAGAYALVVALSGVEETAFWRPEPAAD
ncbi:MAG: hypothetical protein IT327_32400 [Anaerolineae bacterium]|nr:hypothetical protein [Anaerolineae bacterium]